MKKTLKPLNRNTLPRRLVIVATLFFGLALSGCGAVTNLLGGGGESSTAGSDRWTGYETAVQSQEAIIDNLLLTKQIEFQSHQHDKPTVHIIAPDGTEISVDVAPSIRAACGNTPNYGLDITPIKPPESAFTEGVREVGLVVRDLVPWVAPVLIVREAGNLNNGDDYRGSTITDSFKNDRQTSVGDGNSFRKDRGVPFLPEDQEGKTEEPPSIE